MEFTRIFVVEHKEEDLRWYNQYENLNDFILLCKYLPPNYQRKAAYEFFVLVSEYYEMLRALDELKPIDAVIASHLEKSKGKKRWYDKVPHLHMAMNLLLQVSDAGLLHIDKRCRKLIYNIYRDAQDSVAKPFQVLFNMKTTTPGNLEAVLASQPILVPRAAYSPK